MTIFQQSDAALYVDGDDPATIQSDLAAAVQIAEQKARLAGDAGVLVTQHDYWSFTVSVSRHVACGARADKRQWLAAA